MAYSSPSVVRIIKSRRMRWGNKYRLLVGKPERNRSLGRPRRRWVDRITVDFLESGCSDVDLVWLRIGTGGELL
jgi:hypothetical protein